MDISRSLAYPARNPGWFTKMLIWGLLACGVVTTPLAVGYLVRLVRNVARGNEFFPSYADKEQLYKDGLRVIGANFIILFPIMLAMISSFVASYCLSEADNAGAFTVLASLSTRIMGQMLQKVYLIIAIVLLPLVNISVAYSPKWYAGLDFKSMRKLVSNSWFDYLLAVLICYAISSMLTTVGFLCLVVGTLISIPYASFVSAHIYGVFLRERMLANGEE